MGVYGVRVESVGMGCEDVVSGCVWCKGGECTHLIHPLDRSDHLVPAE